MSDPSGKDPDQHKLRTVATILFLFLFVVLIAAAGWLLFGFVTDFVFALLFLSLFQPVYRWILPRVGGRTWLAALAVCLIVVHIVAIPTTFLVGTLSSEAASLY